MKKYQSIICYDVDLKIAKEVALWRAVVAQHLEDLTIDNDGRPSYKSIKRSAVKWIFMQKEDFLETCELAHIDYCSVQKEAMKILKEQVTPIIG